ncbi:hypothetical protein [Microbacterium kunmingense]|uniref:hypothetical protein n=1 Tax=Microbacterium kunmingense TaxID=2915939 RepID=UPI0020045408|nr:hypothetical protein [Microbacterium kunmingense]
MSNWYTNTTPEEADRLLAAWPGAPIENAELCSFLLDVARDQVLSYAPTPAEEEEVTEVNVRITYEDGVQTGVELLWSADVAPDFTGTETYPLSARGLRLEVTYTDGQPTGQVLTTAPEVVPSNYVYAQLQQARNLWNAGRADESGNVGTEGFSFTPRPLDKTIRSIIRPTSGVANVL